MLAGAMVRQAARVVEAQERFAACEEAEAAHAYGNVGDGHDHGACGWCPARGMALPDGHPLCPCGTPRGDDCSEVGRTGAGAKGRRAGEIRHTRAQLAEAQQLAERTAEAEAALVAERSALYAIAGKAAGTAALVALRSHGERMAVAMVALLLGMPCLPEAEALTATGVAAALPSRRVRKAAQRVPNLAGIAAAQGIRWADREAFPVLAAVAADVRDGALALRLLWAETLAEGCERERRAAAQAITERGTLGARVAQVA